MATVIWFIIIFGTIVVVHEFGHFFFAKRAGILVREFSIGMGPKVWGMRRNGTAYTLRILPVGGYVRMAGWQDDDSEIKPGTQVALVTGEDGTVTRINASRKITLEGGIPVQVDHLDLVDALTISGYENGDESEMRTYTVAHDATVIEEDGTEVLIAPRDVQFQNAPLWRRILVNFAGPMNNFILAIVTFFFLAITMGGTPSTTSRVGTVQADSPAAQAGLKKNDLVVSVNGDRVATFAELQTEIKKYGSATMDVKVKRGSTTKTLAIKPKSGVIGVQSATDKGFVNAVRYAFTEPWVLTKQIFSALGSMVSGGFSLNKLAGPVGIYTMTSKAASEGIYTIVWFLASLSINLGIMNLLPIPMLDGGKIVLNIIEMIRRKPLPAEKEGMVTVIGAVAVIGLMIAVTINDIMRYF